MPRGGGDLTEGLAGDRLDQRLRPLRLRHELGTAIMPSAKQFLSGGIYAGQIAEVNDQSSIADHRGQVCCNSRAPSSDNLPASSKLKAVAPSCM